MREYFVSQMGSRRGWQSALVRKSGVKRQTITKWTSKTFDGYPDLETLAAVARAMDVSLWEIVAALEGQMPDPGEASVAAIRRVVDQALDERLGPPGPRPV